MARVCAVCDKGPSVGQHVSHANNKVKRWLYPNTHKMRYTIPGKGSKVHQAHVCTKCLRSGKIQKVL
ncbi:50S ribosomal protein L28 [Candidatus Babeliales bacterium]|nr:50S ribosomal protein L28 [Candidatus Babeliales bacterium]